MSTTERVKYNFVYNDTRNFLILLGKHFKAEGHELIPSGFILKMPEVFITNETNAVIDVIGVPFRNVYNRVKLYYHRLSLSEFQRRNKLLMGTENNPLRIQYSSDEAVYTSRVKARLSKNLNIPDNRFILEPADLNRTPKAFRFKFVIPVTEFSTEDIGLCLHNDIDCYVFVDEPNFIIRNGAGIIKPESRIYGTSSKSAHGSASLLTSANVSELNNINNLIPEEYIPEFIGIEEDISSIKNGENYRRPRALLFKYRIHKDIFPSIDITADILENGNLDFIKTSESEDDNQVHIKIDLNLLYKAIIMSGKSPLYTKIIKYYDNFRDRVSYAGTDKNVFGNTVISGLKQPLVPNISFAVKTEIIMPSVLILNYSSVVPGVVSNLISSSYYNDLVLLNYKYRKNKYSSIINGIAQTKPYSSVTVKKE